MPDPETNTPATVSTEAHERVKRENDQLKEKVAALEGQVGEATTALSDYQKRDAARTALKGKVKDPDTVADLLTVHLKDVPLENVAAHIASEDFAPRLTAFQPATPPTPEDGGDGVTPPATTEPGAGAFGGPAPGNDTGTTTVVGGGSDKITVGSAEYKALLKDPQAYEVADKQGRIVNPAAAALSG